MLSLSRVPENSPENLEIYHPKLDNFYHNWTVLRLGFRAFILKNLGPGSPMFKLPKDPALVLWGEGSQITLFHTMSHLKHCPHRSLHPLLRKVSLVLRMPKDGLHLLKPVVPQGEGYQVLLAMPSTHPSLQRKITEYPFLVLHWKSTA